MFKREKSKKKVGHPVYVYGQNGRNFKFLRFTHKPEEGKEKEYEKLKYNIDPDEKDRDSYVKKQFLVRRRDDFEDPSKNYRIHNDDLPTIKNLKK